MRIQETDRILKEAKFARHSAAATQRHDDEGGTFMSRAWRVVASLPGKVTGIFKKH